MRLGSAELEAILVTFFFLPFPKILPASRSAPLGCLGAPEMAQASLDP